VIRKHHRWPALLTVAAVAAACGEQTETRLVDGCPTTRPNHDIPPGQEQNPGAEEADYHGDGQLWTVLPPGGVLTAAPIETQPDGSTTRKFPWWRGVRGDLRISGHRLDAGGPSLRAHIPSGYDPTGFQASEIIFPTEGCWEVTAAAGDADLAFVTLVVKPHAASSSSTGPSTSR
jgi:hypothetical protein